MVVVASVVGLALWPRNALADSSQGAPESGGNVRARELFRIGTNAYKLGRVEEARQLLSEAWELNPSYDVAATLGQIEFELGNVVRANELLDACLEQFPPIESDDRLTKMQAMRARARRTVAELTVGCDCAGASLTIDAVPVGQWPLGKALYVLPGRHVLRFQQGTASAQVSLQTEAGQRYPLNLTLVEATKTPERSPVLPAVNVSPPLPTRALPAWPIYLGSGLTLVTLGATTGFALAASDASGRAQSLRDRLDSSSACADTSANSTPCRQLASAVDDEHAYTNFAWYGLGVAAVSVVATAAYVVLYARSPSGNNPRANRSVVVQAAITGDSALLWARGRF